ncbi:tetratricopeptide repeat protein [Nocardiopsis sp. EMB25]|uniref:AfsR/SARP family transcriptional regulator n=1 Tax=Nocardiopsis sp. EMB25 TaxID=2835867 RepID=UPI0022836B65|nr:AfsR/SARP family transcriptional regulator [Nocardiopsis sp. EMB25]MCY9786285.1 tetratricopeptide repeat protein [Nocardiopsis sp. EMB25]
MPVPAGRQQTVLSAMLLDLERVVSVDHLIDVLWEHEPPETARTQVQICVSRLRRLLRPVGASIETRPPGYLLVVDPATVDVHVQRSLVSEAAELRDAGRWEEAAASLRAAAELWRGPTLSGVDSAPLAAKAVRLDEERLSVIESHLDIELDLGHHARLIGEIRTLVGEHPLRESLRAQLMLALYRSGRQAEALDEYRAGRDLLVEELGLEPCEELRGLERAILSGDPALQVPAAAPTPVPASESSAPPADEEGPRRTDSAAHPYQLPTDTADFVGREEVTRTITRTLVDSGDQVGVAVLMGRPGVGKSATAMRVAHALAADHYPDGQLYCDLRATRGNPLTSSDVLSRFLRSLGVPAQGIPEDVDERAAMYRGMLASRRVLVVLDDAADEAQLAPLVPAGAGCGVLVTSRAFLTGLPGAAQVVLDTLPDEVSIDLLSRVLGEERVRAEPDAAGALVRAVGRLPLALRIISARLAARPRWRLATMVERLADERKRLDELAHGDMTVRASLSLTYDGIDPRTARAFRLLGTLEGPTIPAWAAGALLDDDRPFPSDLVEPLVDAHMIDVVGTDAAGESVYRFHELVRDFSRERFLREDEEGRPAVERLLGGWLSLLDTANRRLVGGDYLRLRGTAPRWPLPARYVERLLADPCEWWEAERSNIRHAVDQAMAEGLDEHTWDLVVGLSPFLIRRGYLDDVQELYDTVEPFLRERGNRRGRAALIEAVNDPVTRHHGMAARRRILEEALEEFVDLGDVHGEALTRREMADLVHLGGDQQGAITLCDQALAGFEEIDDLGGQWRSLMYAGYLRCLAGDTVRGRSELARALAIAEETGDSRARAQVLHRIGMVDTDVAEYARALEHLQSALDLVEELDDPSGKAVVLRALARVHAFSGRTAEARALLSRSSDLFTELRDTEGRVWIEQELARLG